MKIHELKEFVAWLGLDCGPKNFEKITAGFRTVVKLAQYGAADPKRADVFPESGRSTLELGGGCCSRMAKQIRSR